MISSPGCSAALLSFCYQEQKYQLNLLTQDPIITKNLQTLFTRTQGTHLVVNKDGELVKLQGWRNRLSYQWHRTVHLTRIRDAVQEALCQLNTSLEHYSQQQGEERNTAQQAVYALFHKQGKEGIGRTQIFSPNMTQGDNTISRLLLPMDKPLIRLKLSDHHFIDLEPDTKEVPSTIVDVSKVIPDRKEAHNLSLLLTRGIGVKYYVDTEGLLKPVTNLLRYWWHKKEEEQKVAAIVRTSLTYLEKALASTQGGEEVKASRFALQTIFQAPSPLCRMPIHLFDRSLIPEGGAIERSVRPELHQYRENLVEALLDYRNTRAQAMSSVVQVKERVVEAFQKLSVEELKFALYQLGMPLRPISFGGTGGARFGMDRFNHRIYVIKPGDEGPAGLYNPSIWSSVKRFLWPSYFENKEPESERSSYIWNRKSQERTFVPPTCVDRLISKDFRGRIAKICSLQMFVTGCISFGQYIHMPSWMCRLPRFYLRWHCGSRDRVGPFALLGTRQEQQNKLLAQVPQEIIKELGMLDFMIQDVDCHLDNILVKEKEIVHEPLHIIEKIFAGDTSVTREELERYVGEFFLHQGQQALLEQLLAHVDKEDKRTWFIKHDCGASHLLRPPKSYAYLSLRNNYLFDILPHFDQHFTEEDDTNLQQNMVPAFSALVENSATSIRELLLHVPAAYENWIKFTQENPTYLRGLCDWLVEQDPGREKELRAKWVEQIYASVPPVLGQHTPLSSLAQGYLSTYLTSHLSRIRKSFYARLNSYAIIRKYVNEQSKMRALYAVRTRTDFRRALADQRQKLLDYLDVVRNMQCRYDI